MLFAHCFEVLDWQKRIGFKQTRQPFVQCFLFLHFSSLGHPRFHPHTSFRDLTECVNDYSLSFSSLSSFSSYSSFQAIWMASSFASFEAAGSSSNSSRSITH